MLYWWRTWTCSSPSCRDSTVNMCFSPGHESKILRQHAHWAERHGHLLAYSDTLGCNTTMYWPSTGSDRLVSPGVTKTTNKSVCKTLQCVAIWYPWKSELTYRRSLLHWERSQQEEQQTDTRPSLRKAGGRVLGSRRTVLPHVTMSRASIIWPTL